MLTCIGLSYLAYNALVGRVMASFICIVLLGGWWWDDRSHMVHWYEPVSVQGYDRFGVRACSCPRLRRASNWGIPGSDQVSGGYQGVGN